MSDCVFCEVVARRAPANIVWEDEATLAFIDLRQFHPGHTLVVPRAHVADVRALDAAAGAALMATLARVTDAVAKAFPADGISLWSSIGPGALQEVPHLHLHVHPRRHGDGLLRVYPGEPPGSEPHERDAYAARIRAHLQQSACCAQAEP
ncbi:MAG TPA: HIT domain-containing protein [Xanthomonadales bacterium]|nr:HIT domain-containing protein [Xanthomonadales bacterium]